MITRKCILASLVILFAAWVSAGWADKVTIDPNAPGVQRPATAEDDIDKSLAKKITYDSGYKRLHTVVEDLSRLSSVSIACGSSTKDWRVRDIPVVVCVKDMPLGKLLRAVAAATHTWIASPKAGDSKTERSYRVYRRAKEEAEIDSLLQSRHEAKMAQVNWQWDAMMAYGKSSEITSFPKEWEIFRKPLWPLAKLMATLGPDAKQKMLTGETFRFRGSDPACKEIMNELYLAAWDYMKDGMGDEGKTAPLPTSKDAEGAELTIKLTDTGESGDTALQVNLDPMVYGIVSSAWTTDLSNAVALSESLKLPTYPKDGNTPDLKDDLNYPAAATLSKYERSSLDYPLLKAKVDVAKPEEEKEVSFADTVRAISKASGCNIVVEDFLSHMAYRFQQMDHSYKKGTCIADFLEYPISGGVLDYAWFFNEGDKLLIGWANDSSGLTWRDHHRNLLSESYINGLKSKLYGPGVGFDDAVELMIMPQKQFEEWIFYSRDLACLNQLSGSGSDVAWWKLYEALSPADKAEAKSDSGLCLAKLDPQWITNAGSAQKLTASGYVSHGHADEQEVQRRDAERELKDRVLSDSKIIATMVMRITKTPAATRLVRIKMPDGREGITGGPVPPELKLLEYSMVIDYKIDGRNGKLTIHGPNTPLPVWSPEREAEIIKAARKQKSDGKSPAGGGT